MNRRLQMQGVWVAGMLLFEAHRQDSAEIRIRLARIESLIANGTGEVQ